MVFHDHSFLIGCILAVTSVVVSSYGMDKMLGPGRWNVINTDKCKNDDKLRYKITVQLERYNRTHIVFHGRLNLLDEIDNTYSVRISACKFVDGGCKPFQEILDDCFCCFLKKYAEVNFVNALSLMGVEPTDCPVPPGEYVIENYMYDPDKLPEDGFYGLYLAEVYILKDGVELGCLAITSEFKQE